MKSILLWALLLAAPVFSQDVRVQDAAPRGVVPVQGDTPRGVLPPQDVLAFQLTETRAEVAERMGEPSLVTPLGEYETWQYRIDNEDTHEFSHQFLFRIATGELISITRNFEQERAVPEWFPAKESKAHFLPDSATKYPVLARILDAKRVLLAMGAERGDQPVGQMLLIRKEDLPRFQPWLKLE
jgi:hypothetical protein